MIEETNIAPHEADRPDAVPELFDELFDAGILTGEYDAKVSGIAM